MENRNLKMDHRGTGFGFIVAASFVLATTLLTGCNLQVSVSSAEAAPQSNGLANSSTEEIVGGLEPGAEIQNQLMHSYSHDAMADFIMTNSGSQRH